ncbi:hypothetical protein ACFQ78_28370 [Streptomyces sp. NPDC056519]|uniref:hypothetical protein n=1 Tax=Streptomyces sp. NPDC056519 TaxID=3345849 RepID=UPI00367A77A7
MASLRRLGTLLAVIPVTGGAVAALLACAPPPAATDHHRPAPVHHTAPAKPGATPSEQPSSPRQASKAHGRILERLVSLSAEQVTLDVCLPFQPPKDPLLGGLPVPSLPSADFNIKDKAYKDLRSLCTTYKDRWNTIEARLVPVAKETRPILSTPQGKRELVPIMDRVAKEFHFNTAQRDALPFAIAVATGIQVIHVG